LCESKKMKPEDPCCLIGILDDGWAGLSERARAKLLHAELVIGASRTLDQVKSALRPGAQTRSMDGALTRIPEWILGARAQGIAVVVLATGDPLCHGIAGWLGGRLGRAAVEVIPNVSTLQLAFARFNKPWQSVTIASCHHADAGEWQAGATPDHGL